MIEVINQIREIKTMTKETEARKILDTKKFYMNPETGSVDTGAGWIQDCIDPDNGFSVNELRALCEVREPRDENERRVWGEWVDAEKTD